MAAAGIVSTHAHTICPAMPHRTAERRRVAPTPTIAPVMVCVVLMPTPSVVATRQWLPGEARGDGFYYAWMIKPHVVRSPGVSHVTQP